VALVVSIALIAALSFDLGHGRLRPPLRLAV
jgi:hypothetical protein